MEKAQVLAQQDLEAAKAAQDLFEQTKIYAELVALALYQNDDSLAESYEQSSLKLSEAFKIPSQLINALCIEANVYNIKALNCSDGWFKQDLYKRSVQKFNQATTTYKNEKVNDFKLLGSIYLQWGIVVEAHEGLCADKYYKCAMQCFKSFLVILYDKPPPTCQHPIVLLFLDFY